MLDPPTTADAVAVIYVYIMGLEDTLTAIATYSPWQTILSLLE